MASPKIEINQEIPSVTKSVTRQSIDQFESVGIMETENIHNSEEMARERLGTDYILASGRMSITFAAESLRKFFGSEVFNHTGTVNLKFLRPVTSGDTITVYGNVVNQEKVETGTLVSVDIYCENQNQDKTAAGLGTAIVP
ncbi:MAG: hypothetical protein BZY88_13680 [SAR202 cluster bacterium Io17-Chloro-G9]|nr:MAG: hypothetical protein BZY88_13680 [SAR202 cluster bacterium Io17-Chloro-G9]